MLGMDLLKLMRSEAHHADLIALVRQLDAELAVRDGDDHAFYSQYNGLTNIRHTITAYWNGEPAGCGGFKPFEPEVAEIKRMFVHPGFRRKGIASALLAALEQWALELGFSSTILETGKNQPEAIAMYQKLGYAIIPNYGQYAGIVNSVCMRKIL